MCVERHICVRLHEMNPLQRNLPSCRVFFFLWLSGLTARYSRPGVQHSSRMNKKLAAPHGAARPVRVRDERGLVGSAQVIVLREVSVSRRLRKAPARLRSKSALYFARAAVCARLDVRAALQQHST